jgi:hypothetical protein
MFFLPSYMVLIDMLEIAGITGSINKIEQIVEERLHQQLKSMAVVKSRRFNYYGIGCSSG